ncbi:MAG: PAS domain-containing protein [Planctomycetes bacterium]|nr:PAS domain-containing protein [Planctomycetota bacterium]
MKELLGIIRAGGGLDFSGYRTTTVKRRIARRMALRDREDISAYIADVADDHEEAGRLVSDLLIGVTSFFRDPEVFATLRSTVLPDLISRKSGKDALRIWVAGCSTGQEVYSLAMDVLDVCAELGHRPVIQIFATDINEAAIAKARIGLYPAGIAADLSADRLARYFAPQDGGFRVDKAVRDLCVFARHNLSVDTPFTRIDLISCRNVMIYFGAAMQERVMATFHHALAPAGVLLLGSSEGIGDSSQLFKPVDAKKRVFCKLASSQRQISLATLITTSSPASANGTQTTAQRSAVATSAEVRKEADRIVLERYSSAAVVVDGGMSIIQFRGNIAPYLAPAQGRASLELLRVVHPSLMHTLEKVIAQVREQTTAVRLRSMWFPSEGDGSREVFIEAVPIRVPGVEDCFLIIFEDTASPRQVPRSVAPPVDADAEQAARTSQEMPWLRQELVATKLYLASVIEQHDIASERIQLASDDHLSANEELRITNEELQTAKEEQESANEELATLLDELRRRNHELSELNDDLTNLLERITIPVIILGLDLRIRRLTATARTLLPGAADVGRAIGDLSRAFHPFDLERAAREVVESGTPGEHEVCDHTGVWRAVRIFPYETQAAGDRRTDGAVVTILDIDRLKRSEIILNEAADFTRSIIETIGKPIVVLDHELRVVIANRSFHDTFHIRPETAARQLFAELCDGEWRIPELLDQLRSVISHGVPFDGFAVGRTFPTIGYRMLTINGRCLDHHSYGKPMAIVAMSDLTDNLRIEIESRRFKFISERSSDCHLLLDYAGRYVYANRSACNLFGSSYEELIALPEQDVVAQWPGGSLAKMREAARQAPVPQFEAILSTQDGRRLPMEGSATALDLGDNHYVLLSMRDVSDRKRVEAALAVTSDNLRRSNDDLDRFAAVASHDLQEPLRMITAYLALLERRYGPQLDEKAKGYITVASDGAARLTGMVKAILEYARVEVSVEKEPIDTAEALGNAMANLNQQIADSGAQLSHGPLPTVLAGRQHLDMVFQNLIANAIKYHAPERAPVITVAAEESADCWTFSVTDNGLGIAADDFGRVFELFQRLEPTMSQGSGIGLATSKKIIDHLGGRIWLTSVPGQGSVFLFTVPKATES